MADECGTSSWACGKCTFINDATGDDDDDDDRCAMCREPREQISSGGGGGHSDDDEYIPAGGFADESFQWSGGDIPASSNDRSSSLQWSELETEDIPASKDRSSGSSLRWSQLDVDVGRSLSKKQESMRWSELDMGIPSAPSGDDDNARAKNNGSISALGHMSFAAWESDRMEWTCKACTFVNAPRFLVCGACGMAEGGSSVMGVVAAVEDESISKRMRGMTLHSAQEFLMKTVHEQLDADKEDRLMRERAAELLKEEIREGHGGADDVPGAGEEIRADEADDATDAMTRPAPDMAVAREHLEHLERIQLAEKEEHEDMLFTIEQWRIALEEMPDEEQEQELERQKGHIEKLIMEWASRDDKLRQLRKRLDGDVASPGWEC